MASKLKPGIDFRHSSRNTLKNATETGERSVLTLLIPSAFPVEYGIQLEADFFNIFCIFINISIVTVVLAKEILLLYVTQTILM